MSAQFQEPAALRSADVFAGPERTLGILFEARRMRRRVLRDLAIKLFWMPGKLIAGRFNLARLPSARPRVDCS